MSNIPDFVLQIQEAERNLKAQWQVAQKDWRDESSANFNSGIVEPYCKNFHEYITGEGIRGYGVDKLMQQMDKHMKDMARLTGVSEDVAFVCAAGPQYNGGVKNWFGDEIDVDGSELVKKRGGIVHNENRDRDYWNDVPYTPWYDGVKPGELQDGDIQKIMIQKQ
jgi:hypothetical protein